MCTQLAAKGFNVCMVSRSQQKMEEKLAQIKKDHPSVKTKFVVADFAQIFTVE